MTQATSPLTGRKAGLVAAFGAIYLIWGSTYLAIRIGLESMPPFLLVGSRFLLAGGLLYGWLRLRGVARPTDRQWWAAVVTGVLMLVCGVGGVTWAEQWVPSGTAALLVATVPLWVTVVDGAILRRSRLGWPSAVGLAVGLAGVGVLVGLSPAEIGRIDPAGAAAILAGAACWSVGSLHSRRADLPASPAMTVAIQMVSAGFALLAISSLLREWQDGFALSDVTVRSGLALGYLVVLGSMLTLCCYVWLLRRVSAPAVATYAFVNPLVAMALGTAAAGEAFGVRELAATALIVGSVVMIQSRHWRRVPVAEPAGQEHTVHRPAADNLPATAPAVCCVVAQPWPRAGADEAAARACRGHVPIARPTSTSGIAQRELA
jgi:drug/metabolite transporter (DMT)-like permease